MRKVRYHQLAPGAEPPSLGDIGPFAAVVVIEEDVNWEWRAKVSRWLVDSGCLFMMAWGQDCSLWDESVDYANLDDFPDENIPEDRYVLTSWHEDEPKAEVFWFAQHAARHETTTLTEIVLLDICYEDRSSALLSEFKSAYDLAEREPEWPLLANTCRF